jgi:endonuclease YncB( thermonuclease family)
MNTENMNTDVLVKATFESTPTFSLNGTNVIGKVVRVYDGDTIWVVIPIHNILSKIKIRLYGLDTPELKTSEGEKARDYLESIVLNKLVKLSFLKDDKYGRPLANIYTLTEPSGCINDKLIQMGFAKPYFGGKKE